MHNVYDEINTAYKNLTKSKNIIWIYLCAPSIPLLKGDPISVAQIISNILTNSITFADHGAISMRVSLKDIRHDICEIQIQIADSGCGICERAINKFFSNNFYNFKGDDKVGLGLGIAKCLIDKMKGTVRISSKLGVGTMFTMVLPFKISSQRYFNAMADMRDSILQGHDKNLITGNILVVDRGNFTKTNVINAIDIFKNITARSANIIVDAISLTESNTYNLIFIDLSFDSGEIIDTTKK